MSQGLEITKLGKTFGSTRALVDLTVDVPPGQTVGLVGENGAGKSTLIKILCGVHRSDTGHMALDGTEFSPANPGAARDAGVVLVPQELRVVPGMTAAENLFLGDWPMRRRIGLLPDVDHAAMREAFREMTGRLDIRIDPDAPTHALSFAERQLLVIARALRHEARVLILDEPTASLERAEVERLFGILKTLGSTGTTILFVSHRLEEVEEISDRVLVMRDGRLVADHQRGDYDIADLVRGMTGRDLSRRSAGVSGKARGTGLSATLDTPAPAQEIALTGGRVTGLAGLLGSGGDRILRRLFGADGPQTVRLGDSAAHLGAPGDAVRAGVGYVGGERRLGIVPKLSIAQNILLPHIDRKPQPTRAEIEAAVRQLDIRPADPDLAAGGLSGGNQQKVIFARWLVVRPQVLLLDEPTHGVDIGAKTRIQALIRDFADRGGTAAVSSAELTDLMTLCDEILTLRDGRLSHRFEAGTAEFTEDTIRRQLGG